MSTLLVECSLLSDEHRSAVLCRPRFKVVHVAVAARSHGPDPDGGGRDQLTGDG